MSVFRSNSTMSMTIIEPDIPLSNGLTMRFQICYFDNPIGGTSPAQALSRGMLVVKGGTNSAPFQDPDFLNGLSVGFAVLGGLR